jgi:hypothetical protein
MKEFKKYEYNNFLINLKQKILESRNNVFKIVNKELVNLYFEI